MSPIAFLALILAGLALIVVMFQRERAVQAAARSRFFADCLVLFDEAKEDEGEDGFPRLEGLIAGKRVQVAFIPDSMSLRHLPQLRLAVTLLDPLPLEGALGVLARPTGNEFYALTPNFAERLERPAVFPPAVLVRGSGAGCGPALAKSANAIGALLTDARVREVVATKKGLRVVWQAGQGRRGDALMRRQDALGPARIDPAVLVALFDGLEVVAASLRPPLAIAPSKRTGRAKPKAGKN